MFSIIYFCRDNSRSGSDSSMHASLRMSKRAGGGAAQGESRGSAVPERGASQPLSPWAVVFTGQSGHTSWLNGAKGNPVRSSLRLQVSQHSLARRSKPCSNYHATSELGDDSTSRLLQVAGEDRRGDDDGGRW